jgi:4-hydroxy-2-oxoheptanedioate aldolase
VVLLPELIDCHIVLFIGPWDLGNNLGFPVQGDFAPELKEAIARILKAAQDAGKKSGIYCPSGEFARRYADQGFQMVSLLLRILQVAK